MSASARPSCWSLHAAERRDVSPCAWHDNDRLLRRPESDSGVSVEDDAKALAVALARPRVITTVAKMF
jgi:hypothetical protein